MCVASKRWIEFERNICKWINAALASVSRGRVGCGGREGCPMGGRVIHQTKLKHKRGLRAGWRVGKTLPMAKIMNSVKGTARLEQARAGSTGERERAGEAQLSLSECIKKGEEEEGAEQTVASTLLLLNLVHWLPDNRSWPARNPLHPVSLPSLTSLPFLSCPHASPPSPFGMPDSTTLGLKVHDTQLFPPSYLPQPSTLPVRALTCKQARRRRERGCTRVLATKLFLWLPPQLSLWLHIFSLLLFGVQFLYWHRFCMQSNKWKVYPRWRGGGTLVLLQVLEQNNGFTFAQPFVIYCPELSPSLTSPWVEYFTEDIEYPLSYCNWFITHSHVIHTRTGQRHQFDSSSRKLTNSLRYLSRHLQIGGQSPCLPSSREFIAGQWGL